MKEKMDAGAIVAAKTAGDVVKIPKKDTAAIAAAEQNQLTYTTY
jgi:ethanolamine utilization protein EutQ (cupin superfamily)